MKKSQSITLTLMASLAAACADGRSGAERTEVVSSGEFGGPADSTRRCVDQENRVVSDDNCTRPHTGGAGFYPYFFYFGGRTLLAGNGGAYVAGGQRATVPGPAGLRQAPRGPVSRGGIGARAAGRGGSIGA